MPDYSAYYVEIALCCTGNQDKWYVYLLQDCSQTIVFFFLVLTHQSCFWDRDLTTKGKKDWTHRNTAFYHWIINLWKKKVSKQLCTYTSRGLRVTWGYYCSNISGYLMILNLPVFLPWFGLSALEKNILVFSFLHAQISSQIIDLHQLCCFVVGR